MFASKKRRRLLVGCMIISWFGLLLPWFSFHPSVEGYIWGYTCSPYVALQGAMVLGLCYNKPTKEPNVWFFPVLIELLFISVPVMYLCFMMWWYYPVVISDNYFLTGLRTTYPPFWAAFALTFVPILVFPILWWRENKEILS